MSRASDKVNSQELYQAILSLKDEDECRRFFKDLCTIAELRALEQRYDVAVLLEQGMVYSDILEATGASSATISRVNRALNYGEDGYKDVLRRMMERKKQ